MIAKSQAQTPRVLIVDDKPYNLDLLDQELEVLDYQIDMASSGEEALAMVQERPPDLILLDIMMPGMDGIETCRRFKEDEATRRIPIIFMTALSDVENKIDAFKAGGVDYVTKPFQVEEVLARVRAQIELVQTQKQLAERNSELEEEIEKHRSARQTIEVLREEIETELKFEEVVGKSAALVDALKLVEQVAATDVTVLIQGDTGTGKELFARAIHARSPRGKGPLIKLNCAALPRDLIESELFGHEAGAFTGATKRRKGRFELADGGTLFLDEVGELSAEAQAKLLRVLQEHELERVGGTDSLKVDVRVVAATNKDLRQAIDKDDFREDLYYRLNVFPITVPTLRERTGDVALLAEHFMNASAAKLGKSFSEIESASMKNLEGYHWPGNVRELQNVIDRAVVLSREPVLQISDVLAREPGTDAMTGTLEEVEYNHILGILEQTKWVIEGEQGAAKHLGLNPSTLRGRMRKLGISKPNN